MPLPKKCLMFWGFAFDTLSHNISIGSKNLCCNLRESYARLYRREFSGESIDGSDETVRNGMTVKPSSKWSRCPVPSCRQFHDYYYCLLVEPSRSVPSRKLPFYTVPPRRRNRSLYCPVPPFKPAPTVPSGHPNLPYRPVPLFPSLIRVKIPLLLLLPVTYIRQRR